MRAIEEEYYTKTGKEVVTPEVAARMLSEDSHTSWDFWELFSGSGRLSHMAHRARLNSGPPIDARYGWNLELKTHRNIVDGLINKFTPHTIFMAPEHNNGQAQRDMLLWICDVCRLQITCGRHAIVENPQSSSIWTHTPLANLQHVDGVRPYLVHQCQHGAKHPDTGRPIKKATTFMSTTSLRRMTKPCSGHVGGHDHLQGLHSIKRFSNTALSAVYPRAL
eukprot:4647070-Amphidinium_carterae.1